MTADLARRVRRGAAAALWWPAGMAVAVRRTGPQPGTLDAVRAGS